MARYVPQPDGTLDRQTDDLPPATRAPMPADWSAALGEDFFGQVRYVRSFGRPTGVTPGQTIWLVVEPPRSRGEVWLGGERLGEVVAGQPAGRFDVSALLAERNTLEIVVDHGEAKPPAGGLVGEVRLEIAEGAGDGGRGSGS